MNRALIILSFFLSVSSLCAQQREEMLVVNDSVHVYSLDKHCEILVDSSGHYDTVKELSRADSTSFQTLGNPKLDVKLGQVTWLRFKVVNMSGKKEWVFVLKIPRKSVRGNMVEYLAWAEYMDAYCMVDQEIYSHFRSGRYVPASQKNIIGNPRMSVGKINIPPGDTVNLMVRLESRNNDFQFVSSELRPVEMEIPENTSRMAGMFLFGIGVAGILGLLSLFFFFFVRDKTYLFFGVFAWMMAIHYLILHPGKPLIRWIIPEHPTWEDYLWVILTRGSLIFFALFSRLFVDIKKYSKLWDKVVLSGVVLLILQTVLVLVFGPGSEVSQIIDNSLFLIVLILFLVGVRITFFKSSVAKIFGAGILYFLLSVLVGLFWVKGTINLPVNPWMTGQMGFLVIYTLGLAYKFNLNEKARSEAQQVLELDAVKSRFFANISHEFRTPLSLVSGPLNKAIEQLPSSELESSGMQDVPVQIPLRHVQVMKRNAERLQQLINQLLDLSKLENGSMQLKVSEGNIIQYLRSMVFSFESLAERKKVHFQTSFPDASLSGYFDRDKLQKIVVNLLSNAFKFTPEKGRVAVRAELSKGRLHLEIEDTGPGVPRDQLDKIFDRFYQVEGKEDQGTGIGLSLVKELVELHNGQISVDSTPGFGTTFKISLPASRELFDSKNIVPINSENPNSFIPDIESPSDGGQSDRAGLHRGDLPTALIVEDNIDLRNFISECLETDFQVAFAENGIVGLELAKERIPDLIVSDVMMPEMDGFQLCERLKINEFTSHIPIILLTAKAGQDHKLKGLQTGADAYITKPFDQKELLVRANALVEQREKLRAVFSGFIGGKDLKQLVKPSTDALVVSSVEERFLKRVTDSIEKNLDNEFFSVEDLASEVSFSRSQLHRKLKALVGKGPNELIREFRLARGMELLQKGAGNVSEVAMQVGYTSLSYFTRSFKDAFGILPSEVREGID